MDINLSRPKQYVDLVRRYRIYVDGKQVCRLGNREQVSLHVPDGAKHLVAKIDWCRSPAFDLSALAGGVVNLEVANSMGKWGVFIPFLPVVYVTFLFSRYLRITLLATRASAGGPA